MPRDKVLIRRRGGIMFPAGSTLKSGLVAFWEFESRPPNDSTVNAHNFSVSGTVNWDTYASGKVGQAIVGSGALFDCLIAAASSAWDVGITKSWSFALWLNSPSSAVYDILNKCTVGDGSASTKQIALVVDITGGNQVYLQYNDATSGQDFVIAASGGAITTNQWNMFVFTGNGTVFGKSLNGSDPTASPVTRTATPISDSGLFLRAFNGGAAAAVAGSMIDQLGWWNRVLTPAEVTELYAGGAGRTYAYISA